MAKICVLKFDGLQFAEFGGVRLLFLNIVWETFHPILYLVVSCIAIQQAAC